MNVLFLGTPEFACASLRALIESGFPIVGVVTRADKPAGRGQKVVAPPVKELAEAHGLPVFQPAKVNHPDTVAQLAALRPDVLVVAAFGAILKTPLLTLAPKGAINVHASLLPAYRGVAPVPWSLIHGERVAGVTIMRMDEGIDTGPILDMDPIEVLPFETAGELLARVGAAGGELLVSTLRRLAEGKVAARVQSEEGASYAPRLERVHGNLDLDRSAREVFQQFRGVTPAPGARVFLGEEALLVSAMRPIEEASGTPYTILEVRSRHLRVAAAKGAVDLITVRPPGKRDMDGAAFARGRRLGPGDALSRPPELPDLSLRVVVPQ